MIINSAIFSDHIHLYAIPGEYVQYLFLHFLRKYIVYTQLPAVAIMTNAREHDIGWSVPFWIFGTNLTSSCRATTVDFLLNHRFFLLQEDVEKLEDRPLIVSGDVISKGVCGMGGDDW